MENFYLKEITLSNYRKFTQKTLPLNQYMNVLIGKNAAGKTTILEAVNVMLGAYLAAYKKYVPSRFVCNISDDDILQKAVQTYAKETALAASIRQFPCAVSGHLVWDKQEMQYSRTVEKEGGRTKFAGKNPMQPEVFKWESEFEKADGTDAYQRCLDRKRSSQSAFEYIKMLTSMSIEENDGKPYPAYEVIMEAVRKRLKCMRRQKHILKL